MASKTGTSAELPRVPAGIARPELLPPAATLIGMTEPSTAPDLPTVMMPIDGAKPGAGKILAPMLPLPFGFGTFGPSPFGPRSVSP